MTTDEILDEIASYEQEHEPDGWPAVRTSFLSACGEAIRRERAEAEWLRDLVAGAKPLVEMWAATFGAQLDWKKEWIARANEVLRGEG